MKDEGNGRRGDGDIGWRGHLRAWQGGDGDGSRHFIHFCIAAGVFAFLHERGRVVFRDYDDEIDELMKASF